MPVIDLDGSRLMVDDEGDGDPMVLVHGSWDDRHAWGSVAHDLARAFRVVRYDRRGHTDSSAGSDGGVRRDDENDLAGIIEKLGIRPAHVVGHSFGGAIALGLAARRPELVRSVCVHEPALLALVADDPDVQALGAPVAKVLSLIGRGRPEAAARTFVEIALGPGAWETLPEADRAKMTSNARTFAEENRDPGWADIDLKGLAVLPCPVLLTQGGQSPTFFRKITSRLAGVLPHAEVHTFEAAGHVPHLTDAADWLRAVIAFATATSARPAQLDGRAPRARSSLAPDQDLH